MVSLSKNLIRAGDDLCIAYSLIIYLVLELCQITHNWVWLDLENEIFELHLGKSPISNISMTGPVVVD